MYTELELKGQRGNEVKCKRLRFGLDQQGLGFNFDVAPTDSLPSILDRSWCKGLRFRGSVILTEKSIAFTEVMPKMPDLS